MPLLGFIIPSRNPAVYTSNAYCPRNGSLVFLVVCLVSALSLHDARAQRLAILEPDRNVLTERVAENLGNSLARNATVVDRSLSDAAFSSERVDNPFNLSLEESKRIGSAIGCNIFFLIKAETLRRTSSAKPTYYESYAAVFAVSSRSGRLVWWRLVNAEAGTAVDTEGRLQDSVDQVAAEISRSWKKWLDGDSQLESDPGYPEVPAEGSAEAKNFRGPVPYLRIKPEYSGVPYLYGVKGTVEIMVDLDEKGTVVKTEITRWAGFGLDESVTNTVRKMNWRPAERNGKPLPMRFLLRYNFKKIEKD